MKCTYGKADIFLAAIVMIMLLCGVMPVFAAPAVIDSGVSSNQTTWQLRQPLENSEVKFWMRVEKQGNLNRFGTFDYYFAVQVIRPDGIEVWNTTYGFDENGYAEQKFTLPALFYERSVSRSMPSFGTWKIAIAVIEKESGTRVSEKEFRYNFIAAKRP